MDYLRSDCILRDILEERKSLHGFLDAVFGFMSRNTDFFYIQKTKEDKLGFPRGVKEQILMSCMQKYEKEFEPPKLKRDLIIDDPPLAIEEVEIVADANISTIEEDVVPSTETVTFDLSEEVKCEEQKKFDKADYKNGAVFKNYCWSQTLKDVELNVALPKDVKSGKHVKLDFKANQIVVQSLLTKKEILLSGQTWDKYRHNDVVWTIADGKLILSFDKLKDCWWDKLFLEEPSIDIKKLDTNRPIDEYSADIQSAVEKEDQKLINDFKTIPLNENEQMTRLREAWNAEGSPFKGQPFDPSLVTFN